MEEQLSFIPKYQKLYLCRFGSRGKQVVIFLGHNRTGDAYVVRKWLSNSGRWTNRRVINKTDLIGKATAENCLKYEVDVAKLALLTFGDLASP